MKTLVLKIDGMHCTSCALNIDGELEDTPGVQSANTHFAKQQTEVTFDPETVDTEKLIGAIHSLGYSASVQK